MEELDTLKRQRTVLKSRATRFKTYVDSYADSEENSLILESRLERYNELWNEYHALQTKIDSILSEPDVAERERFEDVFFIVQATARAKLARSRANAQPNPQVDNANQRVLSTSVSQTPVRLPVISLPTFSGNYEQWQQFYDTFKALVHDNLNLDAVQKFHYLQSALSGTAAQVIHALPTTNENYSIALELLTKRFSNTRLTIHHHVHELFNAPPITKESAELLRALLDNFQKHLRVLEQLREPTDKWDTLIIYLISSKLDATTKKEWELKVIKEKASTTKQLFEFLTMRCEFLEALHPTQTKVFSTKSSTQKSSNTSANKSTTLAHVATNEADACVFCKQAHRIHSCNIFKELSVESRRNEAKRLNLCYNCLSPNHVVQKCTSRTCRHCSRKHHTLLHTNEPSNSSNQISAQSNNVPTTANETNIQSGEKPATASVSMKAVGFDKSSEVLLSTAIVYIRDNSGKFHKARALLDNGSQSNFITKTTCQRLGLKIEATKHTISCLNATEAPITETVDTAIASTTTTFETDINFLVVNQITRPIPTKPIHIKSLSIPSSIELADPTFHIPQSIDLLLGATIFWDILETDRIQLGTKQPILQLTKLGWLLCGQIGGSRSSQLHNNLTICGLVRNEELQSQIERFWRIEDMPRTVLLSKEESKCEEIFRDEYKRTVDGRFEVSLPFREDPSVLGESETSALKRLQSMERRFRKDPELRDRYVAFMDEYIKLGHMSALPNGEDLTINYLPHHAVIKEASTSTKLRVVFDASSPTTSGKSLNDCLLVGPTIQSELFEILIRFRQHTYVLTGDIVKMYRQIMVKQEHRQHQCILWRTNSDELPTIFTLNTVTYGVASAPFLAIRSLQQLAFDFEGTHPRAAEVILRDFYVDDLITGESSIQELGEIKTQVSDILKTAGFELTKYRSNTSIGQEECLDDYGLTDTKVLGLLWQPASDQLRYQTTCDSIPEVITKRAILSLITQIFDPLGLIGPVTIKAKILLQALWQLKMDWDTSLPETLRIIWSSYYQQLPSINQIIVPRHAILPNSSDIQLHGFCDASQAAYGACIYIRSIDDTGKVDVQLLAAKSRVAPLKTISLPRLELCAAVILANLLQKVAQALTCAISRQYLWTDSEITLAWIQGEPSRWQTFVSNRVAEIQRLTDVQDWSHVRSEHNPADLISRGISPEQLLTATLWWKGPPWLKEHFSQWPRSMIPVPNEVPETRTQSLALSCVEKSLDIFDRYSSLVKLKRVIATCIRFTTNCSLSRSKSPLIRGSLTAEELQKAMVVLIKFHQQEAFANELHNLQQGRPIDSHSKILSLNPVIDQVGLLRVGGRLRNAPFSYSQKHPILLSSHSTLTDLIIRHQHLNHFHIGPQLLLATLRETYWIIHAKNAIKRVKTHLKVVINDTLLSFEEFYTVITQIKAILNSRPLCPLSNAPDELDVLTPGHFLIGTPLLALPEESVLDVPINRMSRYQLLTHLQQSFWKRWSKEYVMQLQQRTKWKTAVCNDEIQIGRIALIRDENLPPLKWRIGRICDVHPSADGLIRVVSLKTRGGIIQRSLPKICVLPSD